MYVYTNGYGPVKFRALEITLFENDPTTAQFRGEIRLPKGVVRGDGKKWVELDYWFTIDEIHQTHPLDVGPAKYTQADQICFAEDSFIEMEFPLRKESRDEDGNYHATIDGKLISTPHRYVRLRGKTAEEILERISKDDCDFRVEN